MPQVGKKKFAYTKAGKKKLKCTQKNQVRKLKKVINMATNVDGDFKKKGKKFLKKAKKSAAKVVKSGGKTYGSYVAPTVGLFKKAGTAATNIGKVALKFPGTGLAATGLYYGAKALVKKGEKTASRTAFRQYNKKGKWMI